MHIENVSLYLTIVDYTETARKLVVGARKETGVTGHVAYEIPFNYDCAYQIGYMIRNNP